MDERAVRYWKLLFLGACVLVGVLLAMLVAMRTAPPNARPTERLQVLATRYQRAQEEIASLKEQNAELQKKLDKYEAATSTTETQVADLTEEIEQLRALACLIPMRGRGIIVRLRDSDVRTSSPAAQNSYLVHDQDLLQLVNELTAAGAEAISLNDERIGPRTAIRCVGPVVQVNGKPIGGPYVVKAIGDPEALEGALRLPLGILETLNSFDINVKIERDDNVLVPGLAVTPKFLVAVPEVPAPDQSR